MLRLYRPTIAKLLPGPKNYPSLGSDIELSLDSHAISGIIAVLNELGDDWIAEAKRKPCETNRNQLRQQCLAFILDEWFSIDEQCQRQIKMGIN
ncbi:MAG: hypothetical protein ACJAUP_001201 [Cellvibrionaceae bacterium]|jgi:hypothetical protein